MKTRELITVVAWGMICGGLACGRNVASLEIVPEKIAIFDTDDNPTLYPVAIDRYGIEIEEIRIEWASSNPKVVEVDDEGTLTPKGTGKAVVTASVEDLKKQMAVEVVLCSQLKPEKNEIPLVAGETVEIKIQVLDEKGRPADCPRSWSAEDHSVAKIDGKGRVTGLAPGKTSVKLRIGALGANMKVVVSAPPGSTARTRANRAADPDPQEDKEAQ